MGDLPIMSLARRRAKPDRERLCVDNDVDLEDGNLNSRVGLQILWRIALVSTPSFA
jgi:hypothetical protein